MTWIVTFVAGVLLGAGSLFAYLRQVAHEAPASTVAVVASAAGPSPITAALPAAPEVATDLSEADLPLRPTRQEMVALAEPADATMRPVGTLLIPVEGIKLAQLSDNFYHPRGTERHHEALDIMAPKGSKVIAAGDGKVVKLFNSKPGGLTLYQFDPSEKYAYYYAHLDRYADGVKQGSVLKRGELVGYVGVTGNAAKDAPHLHFAVFELTPKKEWWKGTAVNPYPMLGQ